MKNLIYCTVLTGTLLLGLSSCEKESDDRNTNCEAEYIVTTSVFPLETGVINYIDELYCSGDSLLCTPVPILNYEFVEWDFGHESPHPPPVDYGNSSFFYIFSEDDTHIQAVFREIDMSYILSSINLIGGFPCNPVLYPACEVDVTSNVVSIGNNEIGATGPYVSIAVLGTGMHIGQTYELNDVLVTVDIDPNVSIPYDEYDEDYDHNGDRGSFTVNFIDPVNNKVEVTFNDLRLKNLDDEVVIFFGTIDAQGL